VFGREMRRNESVRNKNEWTDMKEREKVRLFDKYERKWKINIIFKLK